MTDNDNKRKLDLAESKTQSSKQSIQRQISKITKQLRLAMRAQQREAKKQIEKKPKSTVKKDIKTQEDAHNSTKLPKVDAIKKEDLAQPININIINDSNVGKNQQAVLKKNPKKPVEMKEFDINDFLKKKIEPRNNIPSGLLKKKPTPKASIAKRI